MDKIRLRYIGGKSLSKLYFNRVRYIFNRENNFTENVPRMLWNFVKQTNEFVPAPIAEEKPNVETVPVEEATKPKPKSDKVCDICGFKAKSKTGLIAHSRTHKKEGK